MLASELGYESGQPRYQWRFSEDLRLPFRVEGKYDYRATEGGIIEAVPVYEMRPSAGHLSGQWVVCRWLASGTPETWRQTYGSLMDYPEHGIDFPTNVYLEPGIAPWDTDDGGVSVTRYIIGLVRAQERKSMADWKAEAEAIIANRERRTDHELDEKIGDVLLPFGHVPGTRNSGVSLPSTESRENHDSAFGAKENS